MYRDHVVKSIADTMGRAQHLPRSILSGAHALSRGNAGTASSSTGLQLLKATFKGKSNSVKSVIASLSRQSTLIVPRGFGKLPLHVLGNGKRQPWDLLPMTAAARQQYPDLFGRACNFFALLNSAVTVRARSKLVPCTKVGAMVAMHTPCTLPCTPLAHMPCVTLQLQLATRVQACHPHVCRLVWTWPR